MCCENCKESSLTPEEHPHWETALAQYIVAHARYGYARSDWGSSTCTSDAVRESAANGYDDTREVARMVGVPESVLCLHDVLAGTAVEEEFPLHALVLIGQGHTVSLTRFLDSADVDRLLDPETPLIRRRGLVEKMDTAYYRGKAESRGNDTFARPHRASSDPLSTDSIPEKLPTFPSSDNLPEFGG